jgi:hypothetical protein
VCLQRTMGKRTKLREAQKCASEQALAARLHQHGRRKAPAFIASYGQFSPEYRARLEAYRALALRAPEQWRCKLRVRCPDLRFLELVKFTFARFPVPKHLESVWLEPLDVTARADTAEPDFRRWYIAAAQGGSLYREYTHRLLSRAETHGFLSAPSAVKSARRALWYAVARAQGDEAAALRVARTKLVMFPLSPFWKDVARYFARNQTSILEMNDLVDFIQAATAADPAFSLNGRTLQALRQRMLEWHAWLRRGEQVGCERWAGSTIPNSTHEINGAIWRFKQIKNGQRLFEEGERMHHCVASYKRACIEGALSIWSLTCERNGRLHRCLTLEVDATGVVVQARGFANRRASAEELAVIADWAAEQGLRCSTWLRDDAFDNAAVA